MWTPIVLVALLTGSGPTRELPDPESPAAVESRGVLIRIGGDLVVAPGDRADAVVVIGGSLRIAGAADGVLVIDGTAELDGARVGGLVVIDGQAALRGDTVVTGDVTLIGSTILRDPSAVVVGEVKSRAPWQPLGFWIGGVLLPVGLAIALLLGGLTLAALAPKGVRRAEAALTGEIGKTIVASVVIWVAMPLVVAVSFAFVVTIPAGVGILFFVLPALAYFGYVIAGMRIGDAVVGGRRAGKTARPYLAAVVGIPLLFLISLVPVLGGLVAAVCTVAGGGAIALVAWRTTFGRLEVAS